MTLTISKKKLLLAMARQCIDNPALSSRARISKTTLDNAIAGQPIRPATLGKIAQALECDPASLITDNE